MTSATRRFSARMRNCVGYSLWLTGEVRVHGWSMDVDRARLLAAIDAAVGPTPEKGRRRGSAGRTLPPPTAVPLPSKSRGGKLTLVVCERGLSVRSASAATDVPGVGLWASPIVVNGARLRSLAAGLPGPELHLEFSSGRLSVDWNGTKAREL